MTKKCIWQSSPSGWTEKDGDRTYKYHADGRLKSITIKCGDEEKTWTMNYGSPLASISDPFGRRLTYTYDASDYLRRIEDVFNRMTTFVVDASGNLVKHITPELCVSELKYDSEDRLIAHVDPDGGRTSYAWDDNDWCSGVTSPDGSRYTYLYRDWQTTRVTDPGGHVTTVTHDLYRNIVAVENPLAQRVSYTFDGLYPVVYQDVNGIRTTVTYSKPAHYVHKISSVLTPHERTTYVYDSNGRTIAPSTRWASAPRQFAIRTGCGRRRSTHLANGPRTCTETTASLPWSIRRAIGPVRCMTRPARCRRVSTLWATGRASVCPEMSLTVDLSGRATRTRL